MTHSGNAESPPALVHEPFRIRLHGQDVVLTDDEATEIRRDLQQQGLARTEAEEAAARAAGQVWYTTVWRYGIASEEEFFSLRDAAGALEHASEYGEVYPEKIRCPDGTVYTRKDLADGYTWTTLPGLNETPENRE